MHKAVLLEQTKLDGIVAILPSSLVHPGPYTYQIGMLKLFPYMVNKKKDTPFTDEFLLSNLDKFVFIRQTKSKSRTMEVHKFTCMNIKEYIEKEQYNSYQYLWLPKGD